MREKQNKVPSLTLANFRASKDPGLLRRMHFMAKLRAIAPEKEVAELTSEAIVNWTQSLIKKTDSTYEPAVIEKALSILRIQMNIADQEALLLKYCNEYFLRLKAVGYEDLKYGKPKKTVKLLQSKLYPKQFKDVMQKNLDYSEPLGKDVAGYIQKLCEEAVAYENYEQNEEADQKGKPGGRGGSSGSNHGDSGTKTNNGGKFKSPAGGGGKSDETIKTRKPVCLNPIRRQKGIRH